MAMNPFRTGRRRPEEEMALRRAPAPTSRMMPPPPPQEQQDLPTRAFNTAKGIGEGIQNVFRGLTGQGEGEDPTAWQTQAKRKAGEAISLFPSAVTGLFGIPAALSSPGAAEAYKQNRKTLEGDEPGIFDFPAVSRGLNAARDTRADELRQIAENQHPNTGSGAGDLLERGTAALGQGLYGALPNFAPASILPKGIKAPVAGAVRGVAGEAGSAVSRLASSRLGQAAGRFNLDEAGTLDPSKLNPFRGAAAKFNPEQRAEMARLSEVFRPEETQGPVRPKGPGTSQREIPGHLDPDVVGPKLASRNQSVHDLHQQMIGVVQRMHAGDRAADAEAQQLIGQLEQLGVKPASTLAKLKQAGIKGLPGMTAQVQSAPLASRIATTRPSVAANEQLARARGVDPVAAIKGATQPASTAAMLRQQLTGATEGPLEMPPKKSMTALMRERAEQIRAEKGERPREGFQFGRFFDEEKGSTTAENALGLGLLNKVGQGLRFAARGASKGAGGYKRSAAKAAATREIEGAPQSGLTPAARTAAVAEAKLRLQEPVKPPVEEPTPRPAPPINLTDPTMSAEELLAQRARQAQEGTPLGNPLGTAGSVGTTIPGPKVPKPPRTRRVSTAGNAVQVVAKEPRAVTGPNALKVGDKLFDKTRGEQRVIQRGSRTAGPAFKRTLTNEEADARIRELQSESTASGEALRAGEPPTPAKPTAVAKPAEVVKDAGIEWMMKTIKDDPKLSPAEKTHMIDNISKQLGFRQGQPTPASSVLPTPPTAAVAPSPARVTPPSQPLTAPSPTAKPTPGNTVNLTLSAKTQAKLAAKHPLGSPGGTPATGTPKGKGRAAAPVTLNPTTFLYEARTPGGLLIGQGATHAQAVKAAQAYNVANGFIPGGVIPPGGGGGGGKGGAVPGGKAAPKRPPFQDMIAEVLNAPRTIQTTGDISYTLRQGMILAAGHPIEGAKALKHIGEYLVNVARRKGEQYAFSKMDAIQKSAEFKPLRDLGLELTDWDGNLGPLEEGFLASRLSGLPIARQSNIAAVMFLNDLRFNVGKQVLAGGKNASKEQLEATMRFLNAATGRGNMKALSRETVDRLNLVFYSPRFQLSRYEVATAIPYAALTRNKTLMKEAARDVVAAFGAGMMVKQLAKWNGAEVEEDETHPDWGKIKVGNTRVDLWGGFQPIARLVNQAVEGKRTTLGGDVVYIDRLTGMPESPEKDSSFGSLLDEYRPEGAVPEFLKKSTYGKFARSKFSPLLGLGTDVLLNQDYSGQRPTGKALEKLVTPLGWQDIYEAWADDMHNGGNGARGAATGTLSLFGAGAQTIPSDNQEYDLLPTVAAKALTGGKGLTFESHPTSYGTPSGSSAPKKKKGANPFR